MAKEKLTRRTVLKAAAASAFALINNSCTKSTPPSIPTNSPESTAIPKVVDNDIQKDALVEFENSYTDWVKKHVTNEGTDGVGLRVVRPGDDNDTVSEGMAYGMLLSTHAQDKLVFDGLWTFVKKNSNKNGLMSCRVEKDGKIPDVNSATDADLDMAYALLVAKKNNLNFEQEAITLINNIANHCIESETGVLKPGDAWGGADITNPSYFSPSYYPLFKATTGDNRWDQVLTSSRKIIDKVYEKTNTGLLPNWTNINGEKVVNPYMGPQSYAYTYDATRVPWRQSMAVFLHKDMHALSVVQKLNTFFKKVGSVNIVDGYELNGKAIGQNHNASFVAPAAAASIYGDKNYHMEMFKELVKLKDGGYYSDSLRALSLLFMSGKIKRGVLLY